MVDWRENLIWGLWNICNRTSRNTRDFHHVSEKQFAYISRFHIIFSPSTSIKLHPHPTNSKDYNVNVHTKKCMYSLIQLFVFFFLSFFRTSTQPTTRVNWIYKKVEKMTLWVHVDWKAMGGGGIESHRITPLPPKKS